MRALVEVRIKFSILAICWSSSRTEGERFRPNSLARSKNGLDTGGSGIGMSILDVGAGEKQGKLNKELSSAL